MRGHLLTQGGRTCAVRLFAAGCAATLLISVAAATHAGIQNSLFKPHGFSSLGTLNMTTGNLVIDTDSPQITGIGNGTIATSQGGGVEVAVFAFDTIHIGAGVNISVTGDRALVLAARNNLYFGATIDLSGADGGSQVAGVDEGFRIVVPGGAGGPGAEAGVAGASFASNPMGTHGGDGGVAAEKTIAPSVADAWGHGYGGAIQYELNVNDGGIGGGGGGYGGAGGDAGGISGAAQYSDGGASYGDDLLTELFGGSGGAGCRFDEGTNLDHTTLGGGGGGGGAIELIAGGLLDFDGTIDVSGGKGGHGVNVCGGGGGSGGGVILAGGYLDVDGGTILADGGDGDLVQYSTYTRGGYGGGGGGGRIALYAHHPVDVSGLAWDVSGGAEGGGRFGWDINEDGQPGTFRYFGDGGPGDLLFTVPEPSAVVLAAIALVAMFGLGRRRR